MRVPIPAQLLASRVGPRSRAAARSATLALAVSIVAHSTLGAGEEATSGAAGRTPPSPVSESGSWRTYVWPPIGGAGGDHLTLEIDSPVLLPRPGEGAEAPTVVYEALRGGGESALEIWGWRAEPAGWAELGSFGLFDAGSFSFLGLVPVRGPAAISLRRAWWPAPPVPPVPPDNGGDEEVDLTEQPAVITDGSPTVDRQPAGDGDAEEAVPVSGLLNVTPLYERVREAAKSMAAAHMGQKA
ncbi:MAG: hypothetical protein R3325_16020, partial [Thermoanaerobaculia bacterium]|nr:hypothetical protein [Thermoanaerobaculia bacterium]